MGNETTTALSVPAYDRVTDPLAFIKQFGNSIARSQMFGCQTVEQGEVFAMACLTKRCDPLSLVETYHVIQGRLSMRADAMLAGLHELGGKHKLIRRDSDAAEIEISIDGESQRFSLSWEDAQQEPFTKGKGGKIKDNWATPRSRMQMLWARVVSDGVRTMAPQVVCGTYTPEEVSDFQPDGNDNSNGTSQVVASSSAAESSSSEPSEPSKPEAIDAEYTVADSEPDGFATAAQCDAITDLYVALQVPHETQLAALAKRGVEALRSLTAKQADEILAKLNSAKAKRSAETEPAHTSESLHDPCGDVLTEQIKTALAEAVQQPGNEKIVANVKAKLAKHGLQKVAELSVVDARRLLAAILDKNMQAFFDASLVSVVSDDEIPF